MAGQRRDLGDGEVRKLLDAGKTPRAMRLEALQSYYDGTAYDRRPSFWDRGSPLEERKPCIIFPSVRTAVESHAAFAMGDGKFPKILSLSSEDDKNTDDQLGLSKVESATLDAFNVKLIQLGKLETAFRQAVKMGLASRSVALVLSYRKGLPCVDLVPAKLCTPTFDPTDASKVVKLEIRYRYTESQYDAGYKKYITVVKEYLRTIDDTADTVFQPVEIWDVGDQGPMTPATVQAHGFGFCPVVWYACMRDAGIASDYDGRAVHENAISQVEALDLALSQRHRAALYAGDPQWVATGVDPDDSFGGAGRKMVDPMSAGDGSKQWASAIYGGQPTGGAIRKGPGEFWRTPNSEARFNLMTLPGDALTSLDNVIKDLSTKIGDSLSRVIVELDSIGGAGDLSGRTLAFVFAKQINFIGQLRDDFGRGCILPVLSMFYRMLLVQPKGVYLPGLSATLTILRRFNLAVSGGGVLWFDPRIELKWGDYFDPSDLDEQTRVGTALQAYAGKVITLKSAIEHIRSVFLIGDVNQYADTLAAELAQRQADAVATQTAMAGALYGPDDSTPAVKAKKPTGASAQPSTQQSPKNGG